MRTTKKLFIASALVALIGALRSEAVVIGVDLGTGLPPSTLGPYNVSPFDPGSISGATQAHMTSGFGDFSGPGLWTTWGQGYTGNVYYTLSDGSLTLTLGANVEAVYLYMEPHVFTDSTMIATDSTGVVVSTAVNGFFGSHGVGFYE